MLALLLLAGAGSLVICGTASGQPCVNQTVDREAINRVFGPGEFSNCPQLRVLPSGDILCDTGGSWILNQRPTPPDYQLQITDPVYRFDLGEHTRDARSCHDALWLVVRDSIDVLSGRDLRIKATLQRAAEACE